MKLIDIFSRISKKEYIPGIFLKTGGDVKYYIFKKNHFVCIKDGTTLNLRTIMKKYNDELNADILTEADLNKLEDYKKDSEIISKIREAITDNTIFIRNEEKDTIEDVINVSILMEILNENADKKDSI